MDLWTKPDHLPCWVCACAEAGPIQPCTGQNAQYEGAGMKRLYHTSKNKPAPLPHNGRGRLQGGYQPQGQINDPLPPPKCRRTEVKAREPHDFTFLPCEEMEQRTKRAVSHCERRKAEKPMSIGDRAVMACACVAGVYVICRGVMWCITWMMTR